MATGYTLSGSLMLLDESTSRDCGHLAEIDGDTPDGRVASAARLDVLRDAKVLADSMGKAIEIHASHGRGRNYRSWLVDEVTPKY